MKAKRRFDTTPSPIERGFSLVEMLVVIVLIGILSAVAIPNVMGVLRNAKVRGAARSVADELQRARALALKRNVLNGVVFFVQDKTHFGWYIEDGINVTTGQRTMQAVAYATAVATSQSGTIRELPAEIEFDITGDSGKLVRFDRLGRACDPAAAAGQVQACSPVATIVGTVPTSPSDTGAYFKISPGNTRSLTLKNYHTGIKTALAIEPGGRVKVQE